MSREGQDLTWARKDSLTDKGMFGCGGGGGSPRGPRWTDRSGAQGAGLSWGPRVSSLSLVLISDGHKQSIQQASNSDTFSDVSAGP